METTLPIQNIRSIRLEKVQQLRDMGHNPYTATCFRSHFASQIIDDYDTFENVTVTVSGRLMSIRHHKNIVFGNVQDATGSIQLAIRQNVLPNETTSVSLSFENLNLLDIGDFVEATGLVSKTKSSEISVFPNQIRVLTKSLRPLPDKRAGITDREAILRRRYLDTTMNPEKRETFDTIGRMLHAIRSFLNGRGFTEFLTPVIQPQYGGGSAKPFRTYVNALSSEMFLSISHELYLKRLIAAGFEKVYTIGRYFRNEGIDRTHQPEFSMLETMTAFENYEYNMDLIEALYKYVADKAFGKSVINVRGQDIDISQPWIRISMLDAVLQQTGVDFRAIKTLDAANEILVSQGIQDAQESVGAALVTLFETKVQPTLIVPTMVYGHPSSVSPLAKPMEDNPDYAERFELFIAGMELSENWTEQNDPFQLMEAWAKLQESRDEYHPLDYDFIEMLEHGMPPTTGLGPGIERMAMLFTGKENIDDVVFFPMLRRTISKENRAIFGIDERDIQDEHGSTVTIHIDEFYSLLEDGQFSRDSESVVIQPVAYRWKSKSDDRWIITGYMDVSGLLDEMVLRISGYKSKSEFFVDRDTGKNWFEDSIHAGLIEPLSTANPNVQVDIREVIWGGRH